jgi:hypothetical protein
MWVDSMMDNALLFLRTGLVLVSIVVGGGFFLVGWYHGWMMFMNLSGHWTGYHLPFGFLVDRSLNKEGIYHRDRMLRCMVIAAPFMAIALVDAFIRGH